MSVKTKDTSFEYQIKEVLKDKSFDVDLHSKIILKVEEYNRKEKKQMYFISSLVFLASFVGIVYSVINLNAELSSSGLYSFLSILLTDAGSVSSSIFKDLMAVLIESVPVISLIMLFGTGAIFSWSIVKTVNTYVDYRNIKYANN